MQPKKQQVKSLASDGTNSMFKLCSWCGLRWGAGGKWGERLKNLIEHLE